MKKSTTERIVFAVVVVVAIAIVLVAVPYQTLVEQEEEIRAQDTIIDITADRVVKKIEGGGYVVKDFGSTLREVLAVTVGPDGRASAGKFFNAVAERYPEVPAAVWQNLAATMNEEYEALAKAQTAKIVRCKAFRINLRSPLFLVAAWIGGFPTINLEQIERPMLGKTAREASTTGELETVDPFRDKTEGKAAEEKK